MTTIELLAPARTADIGIEAIRHGADAVYIGAEAFGARAAAGNTVEDIRRLVDFAHPFRASVYVTVNTIIYEHELKTVEELCWRLWEAKVDALIVQDLRLLSLNLPPIPLHASTQMDNRTAEKVRRLAELGFNQVVLARELTLAEIADIHKACPQTDLEVFVHGALCVSLSGRCNVSEALFGRSANRGECAQVCRMEMDLLENGKVLLKDKHLLSLRDNCQIENLENLLLAGATSLKIEGRLKDMEYVKNITAAYSQALDAVIAKHPQLFKRKSTGHVKLTFQPNIWKSFNRGFVKDVSKPDANILTPKSMGEKIDYAPCTIHNGDGLCYIENDKLVGFRVNNAAQFHPVKGIQYYRNQDVEWDKLLSKTSADRRIHVDIDVYASHIEMRNENGIQSRVEIHSEQAHNPQTDTIRQQLGKLGNTRYEARNITFHDGEHLFIPVSQLANYRRCLVEQLDEAILKNYPQQEQPHTPVNIETPHPFELTHDPQTPLMQTRYCLRRQLGKCLKSAKKQKKETQKPNTNWSLRMKNGRILNLEFDCRQCLMKVFMLSILHLPSSIFHLFALFLFILTSCVGNNTAQKEKSADTIINIVDTAIIQPDSALINFTPQQVDSLAFRLTHHYSENFNFVVKADSLMLVPRLGELMQDTCYIYDDELIAVASISKQNDTVWVKVAHDQQTMGWISEEELLKNVAPDDPISEMLYTLSSLRGIWMSVLAAIGIFVFLFRRRKQQQLQLLKIDSPYPLLFVALTAIMASIYASVQNFVPEYWQEYYFHPSLNPLVLPPIMAALVILVWLLIITLIASCDEAYHKLEPLPALGMMVELIGIGMIVYLVISWATLYYIGYLLLILLLIFVIKKLKT